MSLHHVLKMLNWVMMQLVVLNILKYNRFYNNQFCKLKMTFYLLLGGRIPCIVVLTKKMKSLRTHACKINWCVVFDINIHMTVIIVCQLLCYLESVLYK